MIHEGRIASWRNTPSSGIGLSPTGSTAMIEWARAHVAGIEISALGNAGHHAPEDRPGEIADAISSFLTRHSL